MRGAERSHEVTGLLLEWNRGNKQALDRLIPLVGAELRRLARRCFQQEGPGHTLQPTALINELYLRLLGRRSVRWTERAHFFAFAARTMRRILVEHARAKHAHKRGGETARVSLDEALEVTQRRRVDLLALDDALRDLAALDARQGRVVELRYFGGLTLTEVAAVLGVSVATVSRDWLSAKAWLGHELDRRSRG